MLLRADVQVWPFVQVPAFLQLSRCTQIEAPVAGLAIGASIGTVHGSAQRLSP